MTKSPVIQYTYEWDFLEEARSRIAHEINEQGDEAFKLALSEYGYVKIEETGDIELLRRKQIFLREGRIRKLEHLCIHMYNTLKTLVELGATISSIEISKKSMIELGLIEDGE